MFDRFTQKSIQVVMLAIEETQRLGHREVATVQLLLGLIREETGLGAQILRDAGVSLEKARLEVEKIQTPGAGKYKEIPFNQHTRQVFELSLVEVEQLKDSEIDTQHLLLGLLRQSEAEAIKVLQNLGVDPTQLRNQVFRRLAEQGHPTASQFLPTPPLVNPHGTNPVNAHLELIQKILKHPEGSEAEFVRNNPGIIDPECIENMASILEQQGDRKGAEFLRGLLAPKTEEKKETADNLPELPIIVPEPMQISSLPEISVTVPEPISLPNSPQNIEPIIDVPAPTNQEMEKFLFQLLRVTFESQADEEIVYSFLGENLDKLNDSFSELLRNWGLSKLASIDKAEKPKLAQRILEISTLIRKFEGGNLESNLEIALTGYNIVAPIFTQAEYPEKWAIIQNCLGLTYLERVQGKREENLKSAIAYFTAALSIYNKELFPKERKVILNNLKKAANEIRNLSVTQDKGEIMPQNSERILGYYTLIEQLLRTPQNQHQTILDESSELLDAELIQVMRDRAEAEKNRGNTQDGQLLIGIAEELTKKLSTSRSSLPNSSATLGENTMNQINFINELCDLIFNYDANPQYIYPYLQKNLNLLNEELIDILSNTLLPRLITVSLAETQGRAYSLGNLGTLLINFPYGDKQTNIEIAIISLQISASIYEKTKAINPQNWILTQGELAKAYRNRIKGSPEENIEQSISLYLETLKFLEENSLEWAKGQSNLAVAYIHRIKGNRKENFYLAEECFKQASKIYLEQGFTEGWAAHEYNLGNFYGDLIKLKLEENPDKITELQESRIKSYENALQVWKRLTHGKQWGDAQYNLAQAYNERKIGDPIENQQRSIFHYKQALEFRTIEDFRWDWAVTQKDLGKAYRDMGSHQTDDSQRIKDFLQAIQHYQESLRIYTESESSEQRQIIINQIRVLQQYCDAQKLPNEKIEPIITTSDEDVTFFTALSYLSGRYGNSFEDIAAFFEENLHKFDETFSQRFENWILTTLCQDSSEENSLWASTPTELKIGLLDIFAMNLLKFTRGDINRNIAIAIKVFEITTELWKKENNLEQSAGSQSLLGRAYRQSLRVDNDNDNLHKSVKCYENALQVYTITNFPEQWAECQIDLARTYQSWLGEEREKKLLEAIKCYQNACQYHTLDNFPEKWAWNQIYIAIVHREFVTERAKHLEKAKQFTEKAVEVLSKKTEFRENWAKAIVNLGIIFTLRIEGDKATNQDEAINLYKESSRILTQDRFPDEWAINQYNLANDYLFRINGNKSENIEKAIEYCNRVLSVHTRQSNPKEWGKAINTMGKAYFFRLQGDPIENLEKALDYYNQALEVFNQKHDSGKWAEILINLAALYIERKSGNLQKNYLEAISCCEKALLVYKKDQYPLGWAYAHTELAIAQRNLENWEQSVSSFNYALEVYQADDFPGRYIAINSNLGTIYLRRASRESDTQSKLSYLKQAINCFEETLKIASEKGSPEDCIPPQLNLSSAYIEYLQVLSLSGDIVKPSDTEKVLESSRKCLDHFQQQGSPEMVVKVYTNLGKFYRNIQPDDDLAYENFAQAIGQLENLRTEIISDEQSKQQWSAEYDFIYLHMISICLKMGTTRPEYNKKAFEYSERNKARSLVELINSRDIYPENLSAIELERLKILKQQIIRIQQQLYLDDVYQFNNDLLNRTQLRQQLDILQKQKNQIIQDKKPDFTFKEQVKPLNFSEIQSLLVNSETCAVSWYFLENTLVTFIITPQLPEPYIMLSDDELVFREIINWLSSYAEMSEEKDKNQRQIQHEEWINSLGSRLENLANGLKLDKVIRQLQKIEKQYNTQYKKLLLIPHWLLHLVPLHALPLSESSCLIDSFQQGVNYIPSCQLLQKISSYNKQLKFNRFFGIKNPTKDLFFASLEVDMIEKLVKPVAQNIKILHEDYATKANLYQSQELKIADCLHFSCHGSFVAQIPLFSGLYLANKELLTLGEILELDLYNCYLITLSACETGQVDYHTLSEYIGLPSGFLYAGASNVVASLWSVNDLSTTFLIIKFYENLTQQLKEKNELNVSIALRDAQLWLKQVDKAQLKEWFANIPLKDPLHKAQLKDWLRKPDPNPQPFQSPYYWAGFCAIGQ